MIHQKTYVLTCEDAIPTVAPQDYRDAMSHFSSAVHIVTTKGSAGQRGVTISAACSLSDNPPTILVCLMRQKAANKIFLENKNFCLNSLAGHQQDLSNVFAGWGGISEEERFNAAKWQTLKTGAPALVGALASFDCQLVCWHEHATHFILIGRVVSIRRGNAENSLIYLNRSYHTLPL